MKKKGRKTLTVYPNPRALIILGTGTRELNQALECWADAVARGTAENAGRYSRAEWSLLADCCNGTHFEPTVASPGRLLASQVLDAEQLDRLGAKWLERPSDVASLAEKLERLTYPQAWAIIVAVQFFWELHERIDLHTDEWWRTAFRASIAALGQPAKLSAALTMTDYDEARYPKAAATGLSTVPSLRPVSNAPEAEDADERQSSGQ